MSERPDEKLAAWIKAVKLLQLEGGHMSLEIGEEVLKSIGYLKADNERLRERNQALEEVNSERLKEK